MPSKKKSTSRRGSSGIRSHVVQTRSGSRVRVTTFPNGKTIRKKLKTPEESSAKIMRSVKSGKLPPALAWHALKKTWQGRVPAKYAHMKWTKSKRSTGARRKKKKTKRSTAGRKGRR